MPGKDYYSILGIAKNATDDEIRSAFRRLALRYHPDKNKGDPSAEEKFRLIKEAYAVLSRPDSRANYDRQLNKSNRQTKSRADSSPQSSKRHDGRFESVLDRVRIRVPRPKSPGFGRVLAHLLRTIRLRSAHRECFHHGDTRIELTLTKHEALKGVLKQIELFQEERCPSCRGSGKTRDSRLEPCSRCAGTGNVFTSYEGYVTNDACPVCGGTGLIVVNPCRNCRGLGVIEIPRVVDVRIPPGVKTGSRIRLKGLGTLLGNNRAGDLIITINVKENNSLERKGFDSLCELEISFVDAALGTTVSIQTLNGRANLKIPAGIQSGTILRMKGKGFVKPDGKRGDQLVKIKVVIPDKLTPEQRRLLEQMRSSKKR